MTEDKVILDLFFDRSEDALTELDLKYGALCNSVAKKILGSKSDVEECINDAYFAVWNTIPPNRPSSLRAYVLKIVRNHSVKLYRKNKAEKRNTACTVSLNELEECIEDASTVETQVDEKILTAAIEDFLEQLDYQNRVIFMRRYWFCDTYASIAEQTCLSEKNVSVRLSRVRKQLKVFLKNRGLYNDK